ncbi:hypothetical protein [Sporomusa termitida]|nr:hypothetical protein [Sporomusa termitida]
MFDQQRTRFRPALPAVRRRDTAARRAAGCRRRPRPGQAGGVMLTRLLSEVFDQYVFTRVDQILNLAGTHDARYSKTAAEVSAALGKLLVLARALKAQQPEMTGLVMDFEALTALESGQAAEIAYRQGLRDSRQIRRELMTCLHR